MKKSRVTEAILPSVVVWYTNRKIREEERKKDWGSLVNYWGQKITPEKAPSLEKIADDLYSSEMQRKEMIESKATSLFEGIGFAVSLVSIAIALVGERVTAVLLIFPMINFVLAGICSWHATKVGKFFSPTLQGIRRKLKESGREPEATPKAYWIVRKLVSVEMNEPSILMKTNWLVASYQHFLLGILSVILVFVIAIFEIFHTQIAGVLMHVCV